MNDKSYKTLTIGISSTALFDMRAETAIYQEHGFESYRQHQFENRMNILPAGTAFYLVEKLLRINDPNEKPRVEVALISKNDIETGLRIRHSLDHYELDIPRIALTGGKAIEPSLLKAYGIDLFLSRNGTDVQNAVDADIAAAILHDPPKSPLKHGDKVHFSFDGDQVLFAGDSEDIFQKEGLLGFMRHEQENKNIPMPEGPFAKVLFVIEALKATFDNDECPIVTSLVTMRSAQSQMRPMNTLVEWGQIVDEAYMIGRGHESGKKYQKVDVLDSIGADIFFDDQRCHTDLASTVVPSGLVPTKTESKNTLKKVS